MSGDQQRLQVSPNTYHPHARKGYGRSHQSTPKTLKDVLSSKQKYFQQNTTQRTPWNIWLSVCKGGAACLFPSPCWVQESQAKTVMQDNCWQEPVSPQQEWPGSGSRVWAGPVSSPHADVCALSQTSLWQDWADPLIPPFTDLPASLWYEVDCTVPNVKFLHLRSQANTQDI